MGERLSMIESSTPRSTTGADSTLAIFRIRPQVVDTSILLPDVVRAARDRYSTKFLSAMEFGSVRAFAASHVWAEVPRKIGERAAEMGASPRVAEAIWWDEYVPRIRFVDVQGLAVPRPDILSRDSSDAPTVALAGMLGQVVVTASDTDLRDIGVAAPDWIAAIEAGYSISLAGAGAWGGLFTMRIGGYSLDAAGRATMRAVRHPAGQVALAAIILASFLTRRHWMPRARRWVDDRGPCLEGTFKTVSPLVESFIREYRAADATWNEALFESEEGSPLQLAAKALASSPYPLSRTQMTRLLYPDATERDRRGAMAELAELLAAHPAFVKVNSRDWQLGRSGVDFGREQPDVALLRRRPARLRPVDASTRSRQ